MADISAVSNSFASAPPSFSQKDRTEELRDARQQVSQFDSRELAQNETAAKDQRANSATTVFAATGTSNSGSARSSANAANSLEAGSQAGQASLQQTADAFEQQLQRAAIERRSRPQEDTSAVVRDSSSQSSRPESRVNESRVNESRVDAPAENPPQQVELQAPGNASDANRSTESSAEDTSSRAAESRQAEANAPSRAPEASSDPLATPPERENAEDALGIS